MKTKSKNFGNFFVRVGAGFLAFWLVTMGAFSLLLGQQRAELMAADIKDSADWYTQELMQIDLMRDMGSYSEMMHF